MLKRLRSSLFGNGQFATVATRPSVALFGTFCSQPVCTLLQRVQQVPAASRGSWARQGGFGDLTLQFTTCAVRLEKGAMFPPRAAPEEQSSQNAVWHAVVFWSALVYHLPLLTANPGSLV
ncbi:TraI domain-containing protein [Klebsiella aerogenes]